MTGNEASLEDAQLAGGAGPSALPWAAATGHLGKLPAQHLDLSLSALPSSPGSCPQGIGGNQRRTGLTQFRGESTSSLNRGGTHEVSLLVWTLDRSHGPSFSVCLFHQGLIPGPCPQAAFPAVAGILLRLIDETPLDV